MSNKEGLTALVPREDDETRPLPARLEPLMLTHLALTGDADQYNEWRDRVESVLQADAVEAAPDPESKAILASKPAWRQMRETGKLGALYGLGIGSLWMTWLIPMYAIEHGFGWLAGLSFLLPIPIAWRFGRRLWERAALAGMRDLGRRPSLRKRLRTGVKSLFRSFSAGFGFGFTLVFLQALITWFMTPAPTFLQELLWDGFHATIAGTITGTMGMMLGPLVGRAAPAAPQLLPPSSALAIDEE